MDFNAMMAQFKEASKSIPPETKAMNNNNRKRDTNEDGTNGKQDSQSSKNVDKSSKKPKTATTTRRRIEECPPVKHFYLVCPSGAQTGGPEALHQLCDMINQVMCTSTSQKKTARMLYLTEDFNPKHGSLPAIHLTRNHNDDDDDDDHDRAASSSILPLPYRNYDAPHALFLPSRDSDLVIWPECWTHLIDTLPNTQSAIWWLSVDNNKGKFQNFGRSDIRHFYQSEYAKTFLLGKEDLLLTLAAATPKKKNDEERIMALTEYIPARRFPVQNVLSYKAIKRDIDVVYNPLKGMHFTDAIMDRSVRSGITFTAIGGRFNRLTPEEVTNLLLRAKVYIDFGSHPGMDRLPREAALCGCIVITNKSGAAAFDQDVPIPSKYKVGGSAAGAGKDGGDIDVDQIFDILKLSLDQYEKLCHDFDSYRQWIAGQKDSMRTCVERMISAVQKKTDNNHQKEQQSTPADGEEAKEADNIETTECDKTLKDQPNEPQVKVEPAATNPNNNDENTSLDER